MPDPEDTLSHKLKWILVGPDNNLNSLRMKFDLTEAKAWGKDGEVTYTGTKKWETIPPKLRIDFCNEGNDTAMVFPFRPDGEEIWMAGGHLAFPKGTQFMQNILMFCFIDKDRVMAEANEKAYNEKLKKMKEEAAEFQKHYAAGQAPSQSQMNEMMNMSKALTSGSLVSELVLWGEYLVKPKPQNKNKQVFKNILDGKYLFPQNTAIEHATFDISMENEPDGR
jgi:hypothetical protein